MNNIAIVNFSGSIGKTTLAKQLICPMVPGSKRVQIETINDSASGADVEMNERQFIFLAQELATTRSPLVIDIGGSNVEAVFKKMELMDGIEEDIAWWVVPTDERTKVIKDTMNTVAHLVGGLNVDPSRIVVIPNAFEFPDELPVKMAPIIKKAEAAGFHVVNVPIMKSDLFDLVKDEKETIFELAADETDFNALLAKETKEAKRDELGRKKVLRRMARSMARNLSTVWAATPMAAAATAPAAE